jgi:amino acid adenylation domain-containing protein
LGALFAARAADTPDAVALIHEDQTVTYGVLASSVNRLARLLIARRVGPDVIVPIMFEPSVDMVVAILGIITAGGAWLPLDCEAPAARIATILIDSGASLMLGASSIIAGRAQPPAVELLCLDDPAMVDALATLPGGAVTDADRQASLAPSHLAYLFYTSGTTGKPKGVATTHEAIVNSLLWMRSELRVGACDRAPQRLDYTFDVSIWEMFVPLTSGGALIILRSGGHRDPGYVASAIRRHAATLSYFVPTTLLDFLQDEAAPLCTSLRNVVVIGEALSGRLQAQFHAALPTATLWNSYGPTEAAVGVTIWRCRREDGDDAPPIGSPSWRTQLHILDGELNPVPDGVSGELFIAGLPLARGYHRQPELTREKFLPNPFGPPGSRMYRTGDLVQRRVDGEIHYLGRSDSQIKFNGIRLELGEIEAAVAALPGIARAAVIARTFPVGARLIAYLVANPGSTALDAAGLRTALADRLPSYMIPSLVVHLAALPLTTSGKLDARALPDPIFDGDAVAWREPVGELEVLLAQMFGELTGATRVGADHNFFDLGATSLTAMRLAARLKDRIGMILPMQALVRQPTPAGLAASLRRLDDGDDRPIVLRDRRRPITFMFPGAGGPDLALANLCSACDPAFDLRRMTYPDWRWLCRTGANMEVIIDVMVSQIVDQAPTGPLRLAGYSFGGAVAYGVALALRRRGREVAVLGIIDTPAASAVRPASGGNGRRRHLSLAAKLVRQWRDGEIGLAIVTSLLERVPASALPRLAKVLRLFPGAVKDAGEIRLCTTTMSRLGRTWRYARMIPADRLDTPTVLFRIHEPHDESVSYEGWSERCENLATVYIKGEHLTILSPANLGDFVERFRSAMLVGVKSGLSG